MRYVAATSLSVLIIFSLFSFEASAVGLQEYLQNTEISTETLTQATTPILNTTTEIPTSQLKNIIELVVAGIVASALIISILVLFLGRWLAGREKKIIKNMRLEVEHDKDNITSAATTIREQEKETTRLTHEMRSQATEFSTQQKATEKFTQEIQSSSEKIKDQEQLLTKITDHVSQRMEEIQSYWDEQLQNTLSSIEKVQTSLTTNLSTVENDLVKMQQQKLLSQELLQEFLNKHSEQTNTLKSTSDISNQVSENLQQTYEESKKLIKLIQKHQKDAERSLKSYADKLNNFEEQAYEQFDTSFQVADLARQELTANLDESRKHVETMRRKEQQTHEISAQTMKQLEKLDYSKIIKISNTLDSTQDRFDEIHNKVEETRYMLEELKEIEAGIKQTVSTVNNSVIQDNLDEEIKDFIESDSPENHEVEDHELEDQALENDLLENDLLENVALKKSAVESDAKSNESSPQPETEKKPATEIKDNITIAISDYKMASGDSTPLSFFRDLKQSKK